MCPVMTGECSLSVCFRIAASVVWFEDSHAVTERGEKCGLER